MCGMPDAQAVACGAENGALKRGLADRLEQGPLLELVAAQLRSATLLPWQADARRAFQTFGIEQHLQTAIDQLRAIIVDLTQELTATESLSARLMTLCEQFRESTGIDCRLLALPAHLRFPPPVDDVLFRALRDLLANVRHHAEATAVCITSSEQTETISITIGDNGIAVPVGQSGLAARDIAERLGELGASIDVRADAGTFATIYVPRSLLARD